MDQNYNIYTVIELKKIARQTGLSGYNRLRKEELINLLINRTLTTSPTSTTSPTLTTSPNSEKQELPQDVQFEILLHSKPSEIAKLCTLSKENAQLCKNEHLWHQKVLRDFDLPTSITKPIQLTWYQYYQKLYQCPKISNMIESLPKFLIEQNDRTDLAEQIERYWVGKTNSNVGLGSVEMDWNTRKISFKFPSVERRDIFFIRFSLDGIGTHYIHVDPDLSYSVYRSCYSNQSSFENIETMLNDYIKFCLPLKYGEYITKQQKWFQKEPRHQLNGKTPEEAVEILRNLGW